MKLKIALLCLATCLQSVEAGNVRVLTDRTETHLKPLFTLFEKNTGIEVEAVYVDKGMMARLQTRPTEADIVISKTAENLEVARKGGLLQAFTSDNIAKLSDDFIDADSMYVITSYRPRGFFISGERVDPAKIGSYMDLAKAEWKGKVAIRSGYHAYNLSLFCQMAESEGLEETRAFIAGLKQNLTRTPTGNDRAQIQAVYEGKADVSIGNSYYMGIMMARDYQKAWAEATDVFFPDQAGKGAYVMRSAAGLTRSKRNVEEATQLLDYLVSDFAQYYFATTLHVYSVKDGVPISELNKGLAKRQPGVENGVFKANFVSIRNIDKHREAVIQILNDVQFDN
ncbi:MAG: extracellular solute-binding protein [Verrucomicrobiota bacterium]